MKNRLLIPITLLFCLLILGLLNLQGEVMALSLPLIVYIGAAFWFAPEKIDLTIRPEIECERVSTGTPVTVRLLIHNAGAMVEELQLINPFPPNVELIGGEHVLLTSMPPNSDLELTYTIRAPRGEHSITHTSVRTGETLGLFCRELDLNTRLDLLVRPSMFSIDSFPIRPPQTRSFSGSIPSRQGWTGVGFFSVRQYQPGDQQHHINWRIAARHTHELYTNNFQMERIADVGLILDARNHVNSNVENRSLFEYSVQAAASLASTFLKDGNRVGLLVYGGDIQSVYPGYGKIQRERILKALAQSKVGHNYALNNLSYLPTRFFPARSQIVLISPLTTEDIPVLMQLRASGYAVMLVCPDVFNFEVTARLKFEDDAGDLQAEQAYRLVHAERDFLLQKAKRLGVQVVDWVVNEPLGRNIKEVMQRQTTQYRMGSRI